MQKVKIDKMNKSSLYDEFPLLTTTRLQPISLDPVNGIKRFDDASQNLKHDLDDLENQTSLFTESLITLETTASDCKRWSELSQVLSNSSLQQLDQIHKLHGSNSFLHSILLFFQSFLPHKK